jgi:release factor glutamine methyltransferase
MKITFRNAAVKFIPQVYETSEDSFLLAEVALSGIGNSERVLDVGCGSGIISAVLKANTSADVIGIDINPYAVRCTRENGVDVIRGDLLSCIKGKFDVIIFNPPYLPTTDEEKSHDWLDVALNGGYDGRQVIFRFLEEARDCLLEKGRILMLVSSLSGIEEIKSRMDYLGYSVRNEIYQRFMFEQLAVLEAVWK